MNRIKTRTLLATAITLAALLLTANCQQTDQQPSNQNDPPIGELLPTGKAITSTTQPAQNVGSMPMNVALSPDGRFAITTDMGLYQWIWSIRTSDCKGLSKVSFPNPAPRRATTAPAGGDSKTPPRSNGTIGGEDDTERAIPGSARTNGLYYGLAISNDNTVYAAQGGHDSIAVLKLADDGTLKLTDNIPARAHDFPAGIALDDAHRLYVANNAIGDANPFDLTASLAIYDTTTKKEIGRYKFSQSHGGTSNFPYGIATLHDGSKTYVAAERDDAVYAIDCRNPANPSLAAAIPTGAHPIALALNRDQSRLFVANSLGDTISIIDTHTDRVTGTVLLRPKSVRDLPGVTPTGLALSPDEKTLYVTCADMNAIAVIDTASLQLQGYIPAGWYPTSLVVTPDGNTLLVVNAKGTSIRNPNNRTDPHDPKRKTGAGLSVLEGNILAVKVPAAKDLEDSTADVLAQNRLTHFTPNAKNPLANISLASGKIKHIIYVIKENRTYDQVLGDIPAGNGDPSLVLFGKDVTPNQHALADRFVLLDNLYASAEVSGDGWAWSTQGMANAYVIRNVPYSYSHRGRKFDFEGANNGYPTGGSPAADSDGKPLATTQPFINGVPPIPDVGSTGHHLWDAAKDAGISLRNYGFFLFFTDKLSGTPGGPDNWPADAGLQPGGHDLAGISDFDFRRFDMDFPDSDAPQHYFDETHDPHCLFATTHFGKYQVPNRFTEWNREFQMMLAKDPTGNAVPQLTLIRLPTDHASAARAGKHSPRSYVADNDYGVGQLVEAVSHSPIWNSTAIFIIEDDAQAGVDHVDSHRTLGFVISPFIRIHSVDHHFYNTDSMLKTMELLMGLKPLSQYDAVADPILDWDATPTNIAPFTATMPPKEIIAELNPTVAQLPAGDPRIDLALRSEKMDFSHPDAAPALEANEITWKTIKGPTSQMPPPRGLTPAQKEDDD